MTTLKWLKQLNLQQIPDVKQAKAKEKPYKIFDCAELVFCMYPSINLAEARELRTTAKELLSKDIDPKEHKNELNRQQQETLSNTFEQVAAN